MKMFENDSAYTQMIEQHKQVVKTYKDYVNRGIYDRNALLSTAWQIPDALKNDYKKYREDKMKQLQDEQQKVKQSYKKKIGYAERQAEAKEFEMTFKLADDREIKDMVNELDTTDNLELSLLRMELKERGMEQEARQVKHYVMQNKLDRGYEDDERYQEITKDLATLYTLGENALYIDGKHTRFDSLRKDLETFAQKEIENPTKMKKTHENMVLALGLKR